MDMFKQTCKQLCFAIIECDSNFGTCVEKEQQSFKQWLFKCLPVFGSDKGDDDQLTAIRIMVSVNETKSCRKIILKGLKGRPFLIKNFIKVYNRKIKAKINRGRPKNARKSQSKNSQKLKFDTNYNEISYISDDDEEAKSAHNDSSHMAQQPQNQESSSKKFTYYYYHKILSSDQYSLGKKMADFLTEFNSEYKSTADCAEVLPRPLLNTINMTNMIVKDLYSNYNTSGNNKNLMQFCRASVEKYIYGKLYTKIFGMYTAKYGDKDKQFAERSAVVKATDPVTMLKHLGVNDKYIISDNFQFSNTEQKYDFNNTSVDDKTKHSADSNGSESDSQPSSARSSAPSSIPYIESIKALEQISSFTSPREKLD